MYAAGFETAPYRLFMANYYIFALSIFLQEKNSTEILIFKYYGFAAHAAVSDIYEYSVILYYDSSMYKLERSSLDELNFCRILLY